MTKARNTLLVAATMFGLLIAGAGPAAAVCSSVGALAGLAPGFGNACH